MVDKQLLILPISPLSVYRKIREASTSETAPSHEDTKPVRLPKVQTTQPGMKDLETSLLVSRNKTWYNCAAMPGSRSGAGHYQAGPRPCLPDTRGV